MILRPKSKQGTSISLSKKFYEKSTFQSESELKMLEKENSIKRQMILRMTAQLFQLKDNLQKQNAKLTNYHSTAEKIASDTKNPKIRMKSASSNKEFDHGKDNAEKILRDSFQSIKRSSKKQINKFPIQNQVKFVTTLNNQQDHIKKADHKLKKEQLKSIKRLIQNHKQQKTCKKNECQNKEIRNNQYMRHLQGKLRILASSIKMDKQSQIKDNYQKVH